MSECSIVKCNGAKTSCTDTGSCECCMSIVKQSRALGNGRKAGCVAALILAAVILITKQLLTDLTLDDSDTDY